MQSTAKVNVINQNDSKLLSKPVLAGILTGQAAGLIMAVVVMLVFTVFLGKNPLYPVQVIGSTVFGAAALNGLHLGAVLAGLILHQLGPSLLWGFILMNLTPTHQRVDRSQYLVSSVSTWFGGK